MQGLEGSCAVLDGKEDRVELLYLFDTTVSWSPPCNCTSSLTEDNVPLLSVTGGVLYEMLMKDFHNLLLAM